MLEDYLPEFQEYFINISEKKILHAAQCDCNECERKWLKMDKKIKKVLGKEKSVVKETESLLKMDKKNDKKIATAKKKMKGKC